MVALKLTVVLLAFYLSIASCAPWGHGGGHGGGKHVVIHVPYKVHTVHHHHVEKIPIYKHVPVIKHVPVYKTVHVPVIKHVPVPVHVPVHVEESHGWSGGSGGGGSGSGGDGGWW